ncbi:MAG TPA: hypothetical protein VIC62_24430 [Nakamurella sp.]
MVGVVTAVCFVVLAAGLLEVGGGVTRVLLAAGPEVAEPEAAPDPEAGPEAVVVGTTGEITVTLPPFGDDPVTVTTSVRVFFSCADDEHPATAITLRAIARRGTAG